MHHAECQMWCDPSLLLAGASRKSCPQNALRRSSSGSWMLQMTTALTLPCSKPVRCDNRFLCPLYILTTSADSFKNLGDELWSCQPLDIISPARDHWNLAMVMLAALRLLEDFSGAAAFGGLTLRGALLQTDGSDRFDNAKPCRSSLGRQAGGWSH